MAHAHRLLKALGMGSVHEIGTWFCARSLADRSTSVHNVIQHFGTSPEQKCNLTFFGGKPQKMQSTFPRTGVGMRSPYSPAWRFE